MGPPKKDAFADIFQSAASNSSSQTRNMNMADLQKLKSNNSSGSNVNSRPMNSQSNWNDLDIFSSSLNPQTTLSSSQNGSGTSTSVNGSNTNVDDPFSIFDAPSNNQQGSGSMQSHMQNHQQNHKQSPAQQPKPKQSTTSNFQGSLLDDDEFTDAFIPQQTSEIAANDESNDESSDDSVTDDNFGYTQMQDKAPAPSSSSDSKKDEVLAQLVDIGFPVDVSNNAISEVGLDVQACVNFIMSGGKSKKPSQSSTRSQSQSPSVRNEDFGSMMNDFSSDFFNKASLFFNKSKETVRQNIEQFQQSQARERSGSPSDQLPMWMRNQEQYKHDAIERKNNGDKYEDYGSDEDNIDGEAIAKFMEEQKQRDKEKNQARIQKFKSMARERMNGSVPPNNSDPTQLPPRPTLEPQRIKQQPQGSTREPSMRSQRNQQSKQPSRPPQPPVSEPEPETEVDLLGLGGGSSLSRAERFKSGNSDNNGGYVSSRRRRTAPKPSVARKTTREPLNQFQQSDYETGKETATSSFEKGDYDNALLNYNKCLAALPEKHEWRIIINSNLAITLIKVGDYKLAKDHCQQGLDLINQEEVNDPEYIINDKSIKFWYIKLLSRKAEALEMKENFPESLECYNELVTKFGVNDKKVMDSRRRVNNVVNPPPKAPPKVQSKPKVNSTIQQDNENTKRIKEYNKKQNEKDELKSQLQEQVQQKIFAWSNGKEDNIRALLMSLPEILPSSLGFPFLTTKKITINDLMLPKKVKINYMKVISAIHPDKLSSLNLQVENEMLCQSVFITLNKSWDIFKDQNGLN